MKKTLFVIVFTFLVSIILCGGLFKPTEFVLTARKDEATFEKKYQTTDLFMRLYLCRNDKISEKARKKIISDGIEKHIGNDAYEDIKNWCTSFEEEAIDASVEFDKDGKFHYTAEKVGKKVNFRDFLTKIFDGIREKKAIELYTEPVYPVQTLKELKNHTQLLCEYSTYYEESSQNRKDNIILAASNFRGIKVMPDKELSFNDTVGRRTTEMGYKESKIIIYGEYGVGIGGGVCQVSTALFNAWVGAGLKAQRAVCHSMPISYVDKFFDVMVTDDNDMVLKNDSKYPIYLQCYADEDKLKVYVYGEKRYDFVVIEGEASEEDDEVEKGRTVRYLYKGNKKKKEVIRNCCYKKSNKKLSLRVDV